MLAALALLPLFPARAQAPAGGAKVEVPPIGSVTLKEFDAATFAADTGVAAVVLSDFGRTSFLNEDGGFRVRFERTRRVKILQEGGLAEATIKVPLYHRDKQYEHLTSISGTAWNVAGGKLEKTVTKGATATTVRLSDHVDERRLTLTGARVGSVVEIGYVMTSDFLFELPTWWFEEENLPVRSLTKR